MDLTALTHLIVDFLHKIIQALMERFVAHDQQGVDRFQMHLFAFGVQVMDMFVFARVHIDDIYRM
ncbi:hypothetical protein GCM10007962_32280 [Yeosuana aromativorans]|uniref:Uncharacterized protein n=1 Tax=Yeosuana aromativorans TaxID=288019 RepID=A0A8J3FJ73_9FLAO|nr:hypothetical protein GCM10007962_32280 [Yeosuana aromativorans]